MVFPYTDCFCFKVYITVVEPSCEVLWCPFISASLTTLAQLSMLRGSPEFSVCTSNSVGLCGFVSVGGRPEDPERLSVLYLLRLQCWGTWAGQLAAHHVHPTASISLAGLCWTSVYCTWLQFFWWHLADLQRNLQPLHIRVGCRRGHYLPQGPV